MKCPHCNTSINLQEKTKEIFSSNISGQVFFTKQIAWGECPECNNLIIVLRPTEKFQKLIARLEKKPYCKKNEDKIIFPIFKRKYKAKEVPSEYKNDYNEAYSILDFSPRASATLSRYLLQKILRKELGIKKKDLFSEIEEFLSKQPSNSSFISDLDAVRHIGNFAAHPIKDLFTNSIVEVDKEDAEWILEILESLLDFIFIKSKKNKARKDSLNKKLRTINKPSLREEITPPPKKNKKR